MIEEHKSYGSPVSRANDEDGGGGGGSSGDGGVNDNRATVTVNAKSLYRTFLLSTNNHVIEFNIL